MKYMHLDIDPDKLFSKDDVIAQLEDGGANYKAIEAIREREWEVFGHELTWRYPITDGDSLGAFIIPVREGLLWVPYDEVELADGEALNLKDATILDAESCQILADDLKSYADALHSALVDMGNACAKAPTHG